MQLKAIEDLYRESLERIEYIDLTLQRDPQDLLTEVSLRGHQRDHMERAFAYKNCLRELGYSQFTLESLALEARERAKARLEKP